MRVPKKSVVETGSKKLYHQAFHISVQANIIFTVNTGEILSVNKAACKLLGYSKKELLTKSRDALFDITESSYKKMLRDDNGESVPPTLVTGIKRNGNRFPCELTSAVFIDEDGCKKSITTIADKGQSILKQKTIDDEKEMIVAANILLATSRQTKIDKEKEKTVAQNILLAQAQSDDRLSKNNEWIRYIAKTSYDVMWDWDIASNEIYVGDSIEEVFGYKVENNTATFTEFSQCLHADERQAVLQRLSKTLASKRKSWNDSYRFKRQDGSIAYTTSRASIVRDEESKAVRLIGAIRDISRLQELEKKLEKQIAIQEEDSEKFLLAAKLSFDVIWDWNLTTDELFIGEGFEELFGYPVKNNKGTFSHLINCLHPDDKEAVQKGLKDALASSDVYWGQAFRFLRADGSIAKVFDRASIIRHADGKAYRMIGAMQDISRQKELEERLEQEIQLKETHIAEASEKAKEVARIDLGKELHDNINQLLRTSTQYLELAKEGGKDTGTYLSRASENTFTAIEEIRKLSKGLTTSSIKNFGLCAAIENILRDVTELNTVKFNCSFNSFIENSVNDKFKLNVFRIVQEQLNNISTHAKATEATVDLSQNDKFVILSIADNGIGFDTGGVQKGIGIVNIKSRAASYNGTANFVSQSGSGCVLTVTFPLEYALLNKRSGLKLTDDKKSKLIKKIKDVIAELIHYSDAALQINTSDHISMKLHYDYTYLANVFSATEGISIEKFIILQKIERVKTLLLHDELNLTQIARKLHYRSIAHLSNQFKKVTGLTPSSFRKRNSEETTTQV